jgi:trehalose-phosphatase
MVVNDQSAWGSMTGDLDAGLQLAVARVARVPNLLVACDYDGTLAPIVADPSQAMPMPEAVAAVRALAALPQTTVAVISGRALRDLAALSRLPSEVHLVGSHGSEFDIGFVERMDPDMAELRARLDDAITQITKNAKGIKLERKPASIAVHTRGADRQVAGEVADAIWSRCANWPGIHITTGKEVIELSVVATNKGYAVDALRTQFAASAVLFVGDDVTDENAFAQLHGPDVGIKIGGGKTGAAYSVPDPITAVRVLGLLMTARRRWLFGERSVPIERHTMLSNGRTVALIAPDARVSWLCHPKPDSPAIFADLLGDASAGYFSVSPHRVSPGNDTIPLGQRYRSGTMTVETRWSGLTVTDWLDAGSRPGTSLMRLLTGKAAVRLEFAPRPEFGQVPIQLQAVGDELRVNGSNEPIRLVARGVDWEIVQDDGHQTARAIVDLSAVGGAVALELRMGDNGPDEPAVLDPTQAQRRQEESERPWLDWARSLRLPTMARDHVLRSALTLRGLCYEPTGAIVAAATTSLPEELGGIRNWDYRYCWLRDAAMSARVLVDLGSLDEANALLGWTHRVLENTGGHPERLHPLYTVDGHELGPEAVIETLPGYAGSRPVRVGNAANRQVQLDVFGPLADLLSAVTKVTGELADWQRQLLEDMVRAVQRRWHEPDHGIWEARLPPRHNVYSKVMCWLTVDRAVNLLDRHGHSARPEWIRLRDRIAHNVLTYGWNKLVGAYTVAYGSQEMDASSIWIGLSGLLADDDPRFLATVLAIEADLRSGPIVYRYRWDDGLPGREGGFHVCSAWMIEAYLRTGRRADAEELFAQMLDCAGPTGLLPEQYDPITERGLGNHPQAYSHLGLIRCALLLDRAAPGRTTTAAPLA